MRQRRQVRLGKEGRGGDRSGRGQCHDYRETVCDLIYCWEPGPEGPATCKEALTVLQPVSTDKPEKISVYAQVAVESTEPTAEGHRAWPMNARGCLLKVDSVIFTRSGSPWSISQWPPRNKGQNFYHMVLKNNSKSS